MLVGLILVLLLSIIMSGFSAEWWITRRWDVKKIISAWDTDTKQKGLEILGKLDRQENYIILIFLGPIISLLAYLFIPELPKDPLWQIFFPPIIALISLIFFYIYASRKMEKITAEVTAKLKSDKQFSEAWNYLTKINSIKKRLYILGS
jgi:SNF family Na+-dependent transporter